MCAHGANSCPSASDHFFTPGRTSLSKTKVINISNNSPCHTARVVIEHFLGPLSLALLLLRKLYFYSGLASLPFNSTSSLSFLLIAGLLLGMLV